MNPLILKDIYNKENYYKYLKENSSWIRLIKRDDNKYKEFIKYVKEKYKLRVTDKVNNITNIVGVLSEVLSINK